jgi:L-alanine-DL-glutamate epimerase-like enolase superfamily enzyme
VLITALETRLLAAELPIVFRAGTYEVARRSAVLCRISTDEGLTAEVCVGNEFGYSDFFFDLLSGPFRDLLVGQDPLEIERHWKAMLGQATGYVDRESVIKALSTVDVALWDLKGRICGQPLHRLVGGRTRRVPMIAIAGYYESGSAYDDIAAEIERLRAYGVIGVKWKVGRLHVEADARRVAHARRAAGDDFIIVADSNMAWTPADAVRFARLVEDLGISWLEEPVHWSNQLRGLREVRGRTPIPVAAGQSVVSVFDCYDLLAGECVDILNVTANRGGGISGWLKVAGAGFLADVRMAHVAEPHIAMHLMAGIANPTFVECYADPRRDPFWEELYPDRPQLSDGHLVLGDRPGLGLELDPRAVEKYAVTGWR